MSKDYAWPAIYGSNAAGCEKKNPENMLCVRLLSKPLYGFELTKHLIFSSFNCRGIFVFCTMETESNEKEINPFVSNLHLHKNAYMEHLLEIIVLLYTLFYIIICIFEAGDFDLIYNSCLIVFMAFHRCIPSLNLRNKCRQCK